MRPLLIALSCLVTASWIAGCATERLDASAPAGVNLSGEWKFDPNLSDDPNRLADPDEAPQRGPGGHRGHGGGRGGGGMPPMGGPGGGGYNFGPGAGTTGAAGSSGATGNFHPARGDFPAAGDGVASETAGLVPVALTAPGIEQTAPLPPAGTPASGNGTNGTNTTGRAGNRGASINRLLQAPAHMSITQQDGNLLIKANMPDGTRSAEEYKAGTQTTIPYAGDGTAVRSVGWRGPVFVVTTTVKKGGWREDDFALDDDGHLIMTTLTKGGRLGKLEIKRVYDRLRGAATPNETGTPGPVR